VLVGAALQGASLDNTFLWRARLQPNPSQWKGVSAGVLDWGPEQVSQAVPQAWTDATYAELRQSIERVVPEGRMRDAALGRVARLDCSLKNDTLASCDPGAASPNAVEQWKSMTEKASVDHFAYAQSLAVILGDLVCSNEPDRIWVLRGLLLSNRWLGTGSLMPALTGRIISAGCTVSTALTDADKRKIAVASWEVSSALHNPMGRH
jgi:hypothetical protein